MVLTSYFPLMISLTRPCALPVAAPIRIWLSPAHCLSNRNSSPMSRLAKARLTSGRDQNSGGIVTSPIALSRMSLPYLAGAAPRKVPERKDY